MTLRIALLLGAFALTLAFVLALVASAWSPPAPTLPPDRAQVQAALQRAPLLVIQNVGQFDPQARFQVRGGAGGGSLWLAQDALWLTVWEATPPSSPSQGEAASPSPQRGGWLGRGEQAPARRGVHLKLSFIGANPQPRLEPFQRLGTHVSYFLGNDPAKWHADVPVWGGVRYVDLYPGIDLEWNQDRPGLRLIARPGADLSVVRLQVEGAEEVAVEGGGVRLDTAAGPVRLPPLLSGEGVALQPGVVDGLIAFAPPPVQLFPLFPAPPGRGPEGLAGLLYSTFLGGSGDDGGDAIALDGSGAAYVTGYTASTDFPTTPGAFDPSHNGVYDAFVTRLNAEGSGLVYSTFLGGSGDECYDAHYFFTHNCDITVDSDGTAYVTGTTDSTDFPTTPGAFDPSFNGGYYDAFVTRLNAEGSGLEYSTFLGGSGDDWGFAIVVGGSGAAYVTGYTESSDFPTTPGAFDPSFNGGYYDAFVTRLNAAGSGLEYSTFLGGSGDDRGFAIALDGSGAAYVTGLTDSTDFPTTPGAFDPSFNGYADAFVTRLNAAGSGLVYSTFLGGSYDDVGDAIALDGSGAAYVTGYTSFSTDFPTTPGAFDPSYNGGGDAFVTRLNAAGSGLEYSTFLGGSEYDGGSAIALDGSGAAYVTGSTASTNFPTTPGAFDPSFNGGYYDAFVTRLNAEGSGLVYSTFLGGNGWDIGSGITLDGAGAAYVTGRTYSTDFPTTPGAFDPSYNGYWDAFVTKLGMEGGPGLSISHIEITQATQDEGNNVVLVAGKRTFVRVYVDCGVPGCSMPNVTGQLQVSSPGGTATVNPSPPGTIVVEHPGSWTDQRRDLNKTLNFLITDTILLTGDVTFTATVEGASNSLSRPFQPAQTLEIAYVPVRYEPPWWSNCPGVGEPTNRIGEAFAWAQRVYPTARVNYSPLPTMPFREPLCGILRWMNTNKLFIALMDWNRLVTNDPAPYVFGWLPEDAYGGGISNPTWGGGGGIAAFGDDNRLSNPNDWGQRIFAHEIGHLLGRRHTNSSTCFPNNIDPQTDWPYTRTHSLIVDWGLDLQTVPIPKNPNTTYDYMSYCGRAFYGTVWTSSFTYERIFDDRLRRPLYSIAAQSVSTTAPYFIASGLVYTDSTANLNPIWVITSTIASGNPPLGTEYCLEAQDASGVPMTSYCFDLAFFDYEAGEATNVDGFSLMLPYPAGVARIVLKQGTTELAVRTVSANPPIVTVLSPNGGEIWGVSGTYTITWTASDPDGDPLTYSVLYSPDQSNWVPVGTAITQTQLAVNAAELVGGSGAKVRVLVSDGVNTSADESNEPFTVGRKAPQAFIMSPTEDVTITLGTLLWLEGYAYDLEDGPLGEEALRWSSSLGGELGTGSLLPVMLSEGQHVITLTATDSDGNVGIDTVNVNVVPHRIYLPLILNNR